MVTVVAAAAAAGRTVLAGGMHLSERAQLSWRRARCTGKACRKAAYSQLCGFHEQVQQASSFPHLPLHILCDIRRMPAKQEEVEMVVVTKK